MAPASGGPSSERWYHSVHDVALISVCATIWRGPSAAPCVASLTTAMPVACVGLLDGACVGAYVGGVGAFVGAVVGDDVGGVGACVGAFVGGVGASVGAAVGALVGTVGACVGACVGTVGAAVGVPVGTYSTQTHFSPPEEAVFVTRALG